MPLPGMAAGLSLLGGGADGTSFGVRAWEGIAADHRLSPKQAG